MSKFNFSAQTPIAQVFGLLKEGDLFFSAGNYLFSKAVRKLSDSEVSHVGFVGKLYERWVLFESVSDDGVRIVPLESYTENYENTGKGYDGRLFIGRDSRFPAGDAAKKTAFFQTAVDLLNYNYDKATEKKVLLNSLFGLGKNVDDEKLLCSEFVQKVFKSAGIEYLSRHKKGFFFPEDVAQDENVEILLEIENTNR